MSSMCKYLIFIVLSFIFPLRAEPPCEIVIFGATGDLTARKVLPALYHLDKGGGLPKETTIIGVGRRDWTAEDLQKLQPGLEHLIYHQMDLADDEGYKKLGKLSKGNRLFYLATPPSQFPVIIEKLQANGLLYPPGDPRWSRVIIEKPFGRDLTSARELEEQIAAHLDKTQVYRIDHYLGKEGVQKLLALRHEDGRFEALWDRDHIERVEISLSEKIGIGDRGKFWEETWLLRDIFQNHLFQLVALIGMERTSPVHAAKIQLLEAIRVGDPKEFIRGQYGPGEFPGYRQEKNVAPDSNVETFASAQLWIDNPRWEGVPFHLTAGKRLPEQKTEIKIQFKEGDPLLIRIQPDPAIYLGEKRIDPVADRESPDAYERLIHDCLLGHSDLFVQPEEPLAAWRWLDPVLKEWEATPAEDFPNY